jgi:hypothetical protein
MYVQRPEAKDAVPTARGLHCPEGDIAAVQKSFAGP